MNVSQSKYIRIRDKNDCTVDVENLIKSLETQYKIDIRSLPQWKDLIKTLYDAQRELKTKLQNASERKKSIIEKLYIQKYRPSPFDLTNELARTINTWEEIELSSKTKRILYIKEIPESNISLKRNDLKNEELLGEDSDIRSTAHPNTEEVEPREEMTEKLDVNVEIKSESSLKLPVMICTNPHKFLSPLRSDCTHLCYHSSKPSIATIHDQLNGEWNLNQTKAIRSYPDEININCNNDQLTSEQSTKFTLKNCTNNWAFVRFKGLTNRSNLQIFKLTPVTPVKLYAGLSRVYCLHFKLMPNIKDYEGVLNFKIGRISIEIPEEILSIRFTCKYHEKRTIYVTESVSIPPAYSWQLRNDKFPEGHISIRIEDDYYYHLHVVKRDVNWSQILHDKSMNSLNVLSPTSESVFQRNAELESQNILCSSSKFDQNPLVESINTEDIVYSVLLEIVDTSLQSFFLKHTYLYLVPQCVRKIQVNFTKAENIGPHQCCYDLQFYNPINDNLITTKKVNVFAEILPHPIQIVPLILDMTATPVNFGLCVDHFMIANTHKFIPVTVKIKLTTKMKKIFHISPIETLIPAQTEVQFEVRLCSRSHIENNTENVHFTIKIIVIGDKSVYENSQPLFYELIIPCASEFKKVYGNKYFDSVPDSNDYVSASTSEVENEPPNTF